MIVPKGRVALSEVYKRFSEKIQEIEGEEKTKDELEVKINSLCWEFCSVAKRVFLQKNIEKSIDAPKDYIQPPEGGTHLRANELVDLKVGVPGSGTVNYVAVGKGPKVYDMFGPYFRSPILFEQKEFEKFFLKTVGGANGSSGHSLIGIKNKFLQNFEAGTYKNKEEEWDHYNGKVSKSTFNEAFKAAKKENPSFGKVGRPAAKK